MSTQTKYYSSFISRNVLIGTVFLLLLSSCVNHYSFKDAVSYWSLSDLNDRAGFNSLLKTHGEISFITLSGEEASASKVRGGDGIVARLDGGWLDAGQGVNSELNLSGKNISVLLRIKPGETNGYSPLVNKSGDDQSIAYSIALNRTGDGVYIESKIGSDEIGGAHLLRYNLDEDALFLWHDIIFRFNGKTSELYVDGRLADDEVTVGEIRDWNRKPVLIGAQYAEAYGYGNTSDDHIELNYNGLIDHIVLWNRYLSDEEIDQYSAVKELGDARPKYYHEKYRPQFHFTAKKNWLNDPNGLVYYNGQYHLFFQYMPPHRPGAYKDWGHAVSTDLVHWEQIPNHITPHKVWAGCWSGSAVVDENNVAGFQVGDEKTIVAFLTNGGNPAAGLGPLCTQCIAYSTDGGKTFTYYDQNPVIPNIYNANRDPKVVWDDVSKKWIMSLYMDKDFDFGLFSSSNLKDWEFLSTVSLKGVAECPGFEPLPVDGNATVKKWLFFGANGNYMIGSFDGRNFIPETDVLRGDYGKNFYAAQTWSNVPDNRCIHIAWMPTQRYPGMPFEQQMNFPTELSLKTTSKGIRVYRVPVREISSLYDQELKWNNRILKGGENLFSELKGDLFDIDMEIETGNSDSFVLGVRGAAIRYDGTQKKIICGGPSVENNIIPSQWSSNNEKKGDQNNLGEAPLAPLDGIVKLRVLVDRTSIEVFGNDGEVVLTSCFKPDDDNLSYTLVSSKDLKIVKAEVHSLKPAWRNE